MEVLLRVSCHPLLLILLFAHICHAQLLCEPETGDSTIIIDIRESNGTEVSQATFPAELPIRGDTLSGQISLRLIKSTPSVSTYFILNGKRLQLQNPLDRDATGLNSLQLQIECKVMATGARRNIAVIIRINDINDNPPVFINTPYSISIPELTLPGTTVFRGIGSKDMDSEVNGLVEYFVLPGDRSDSDGYEKFTIKLPYQGYVTLNTSLDYEKTPKYYVTVVANDGAANPADRYSVTTTLTVNVLDSDDQDPAFTYIGCTLVDGACISPEYTSKVTSGVLAGVVDIYPEAIRAVDRDSLNANIRYSFLRGSPSFYRSYFEIDPETGKIRQIQKVDRTRTKEFELYIKAEEVSSKRRYATARLTIAVQAQDLYPPVLKPSSDIGFVDENSAVGTPVMSNRVGTSPITFTVSDRDLTPGEVIPEYRFELTTDAFTVDKTGTLVVNQPDLDRDPPYPGRLAFQVIAREVSKRARGPASAPISIIVLLNDVNDNAPRLPAYPPVRLQAGDSRRLLLKVKAEDADTGENARVVYSIFHVSNNGRPKFSINETTGYLEVISQVNAGEQYSITVEASDAGHRRSRSIVEVMVTRGPNQAPPIFKSQIKDVRVSEGAAVQSAVISLNAEDPEGDEVTYSILRGNEAKHFSLEPLSGVISVSRQLDRESLSRYSLIVEAKDEGGLSSTATVNILVTDINDKNPEFLNLPYSFRVAEGLDGALVGRVKAVDADANENAEIYFSVPNDSHFAIDRITGDIRTRHPLDYERQQVYYVVVTARDGARDPRISTATVTVLVGDEPDEAPRFKQRVYEAEVPENRARYDVTRVRAEDMDSVQSVTYMLRSGSEFFTIDPRTGMIRTLRELDYERANKHVLIVATRENIGSRFDATARVIVKVKDVNDNPPSFTSLPRPLRIKDTDLIGSRIAKLLAMDADGTAPGNKVNYEIIGQDKARNYFAIDRDSGEITIRDDLQKEADTLYKVVVKAFDLGDPPLSSSTTVTVHVEHTATLPPDRGIGFADTEHTVEISEKAKKDTLVKTLTLLNKPTHGHIPLECVFESGNEDGLFNIYYTKDKDCEIRLTAGKLDHEKKQKYILNLRLKIPVGLMSPERQKTRVSVNVMDENDNIPSFIFRAPYTRLTGPQYFATIPEDTKVDSSVSQVMASDADSGKNGEVMYELDSASDPDGYFVIEPTSGIIRVQRDLQDVNPDQLPFRLRVIAKDKPGLSESVSVVVNLIGPGNRLIISIPRTPPEKLQSERGRLVEVLQDHTQLVIGVEDITSYTYLTPNNTIVKDRSGTDILFYAIDPKTQTILNVNDSVMIKKITTTKAEQVLLYYMNGNLGVEAKKIHVPLQAPTPIYPSTVISAGSNVDGFEGALLALAAIIVVLGVAGIVYICVAWTRYKQKRENLKQVYMVPRYEPVVSDVATLKEYETQVLQMSVPIDEISETGNDFQLDFSNRNHTLQLDAVSYITKEHMSSDDSGQSSERASPSDLATTVRASSLAAGSDSGVASAQQGTSPDPQAFTDEGILTYERSDDGLPVSVSATNENVTFRQSRDFSAIGGFSYLPERSPIDTTTEL